MGESLTQKFVYETDRLDSFKRVLNTIVRVMYNEKPTEYSHLFLTRREGVFVPKWEEHDVSKENPNFGKPKFLHVCSIGDYKKRIIRGDEQFEDYAKLIDRVMAHLRNVSPEEFIERCGDGFCSWFNGYDGSVKPGVRLSQRPDVGWDWLDISLCHIYYGK